MRAGRAFFAAFPSLACPLPVSRKYLQFFLRAVATGKELCEDRGSWGPGWDDYHLVPLLLLIRIFYSLLEYCISFRGDPLVLARMGGSYISLESYCTSAT